MSIHGATMTLAEQPRRSSAAPISTTSRRSSPSPTPIPTRSSTRSRTTPTPSSPGTTACSGRSCESCTRRPRSGSGTPSTDLDWSIEVDLEKVVAGDQVGIAAGIDPNLYDDTVIGHWGEKEWLAFGIQNRKWTLSQFLHGEQGALLCTAKIAETVPWYDAKLYASTQVVDEARHVEVFARYLDEKMDGGYQVNAHLRMLLDDIINDSRWDMTYLGMQVMVEGLALAAFGFMHQMTEEPLLKKLLRYVMSDEARHVAFGVLSLKEVYDGMTDAEMKDRQEFAYEAAVRMRDRFLSAGGVGADGRRPHGRAADRPTRSDRDVFQQMLFSKIVPNCKKLGLLDRNDRGCATASRRWA